MQEKRTLIGVVVISRIMVQIGWHREERFEKEMNILAKGVEKQNLNLGLNWMYTMYSHLDCLALRIIKKPILLLI